MKNTNTEGSEIAKLTKWQIMGEVLCTIIFGVVFYRYIGMAWYFGIGVIISGWMVNRCWEEFREEGIGVVGWVFLIIADVIMWPGIMLIDLLNAFRGN